MRCAHDGGHPVPSGHARRVRRGPCPAARFPPVVPLVPMTAGGARVEAVCASPGHTMAKAVVDSIRLVAGEGVEGDVHRGTTITLRRRGRPPETVPNTRQVHLIHGELHDDLQGEGFELAPGQMGENVTTRGLDLLGLAQGTRLRLGAHAVVELTGLRTPCRQLDAIQPGLMSTLAHGGRGDAKLAPRVGVMAVVVAGGEVRPGDPIAVEPPGAPHSPLRPI